MYKYGQGVDKTQPEKLLQRRQQRCKTLKKRFVQQLFAVHSKQQGDKHDLLMGKAVVEFLHGDVESMLMRLVDRQCLAYIRKPECGVQMFDVAHLIRYLMLKDAVEVCRDLEFVLFFRFDIDVGLEAVKQGRDAWVDTGREREVVLFEHLFEKDALPDPYSTCHDTLRTDNPKDGAPDECSFSDGIVAVFFQRELFETFCTGMCNGIKQGHVCIYLIGKGMQFVKRVLCLFHDRLAQCTCCTANAYGKRASKVRGECFKRFLCIGKCFFVCLFTGGLFVKKELFETYCPKIE